MIIESKIEGLYQKTRALVDSGQFEASVKELGDHWKGIGKKPDIDNVSEPLNSKMILICGVLTGWLGSAKQIEGSQEMAKDLICEASDNFESEDLSDLWAESRGELALCYWREGAFSEARIILQDALDKLSNNAFETKAILLLRLVNVEISTYNYENAKALLQQADKLTDSLDSPLLCGKVFFHYALVVRRLAEEENNHQYLNDSLKYYEVAKKYYTKAGHKLYEAVTDNNLGYVLCELKEFKKAHKYLDDALTYFTEIDDNARMSLVYDNKARVLLAEKKLDEAEKNAEIAVTLIKKGDEQSSLAEYLTTLGHILAIKNDLTGAKKYLIEASEIAYRVGDLENSGLAILTLIEDLSDTDLKGELVNYYLKADGILSRTTQKTVINRLNRAAKLLLQTDQPSESAVKSKINSNHFAGKSLIAQNIRRKAEIVAKTADCILITGESGTGKELLAQEIHELSGTPGSFKSISCSVFADPKSNLRLFQDLPENLSNNISGQKSLFDYFDAGTLFLKEVEMLSAADQANLISILENNDLDSDSPHISGKCRLICSTESELEDLTVKGLFRKDLFYKLSIFNIYIPPLKDRKEDVSEIVRNFLKKYPDETVKILGKDFFDEIERTNFEGNGNELKAFIAQSIWHKTNGLIDDLHNTRKKLTTPEKFSIDNWEDFYLPDELNNYEAQIISKALQDAEGQITRASNFLGISHQNLSALLKKRHKNLKSGLKSRKKRTALVDDNYLNEDLKL